MCQFCYSLSDVTSFQHYGAALHYMWFSFCTFFSFFICPNEKSSIQGHHTVLWYSLVGLCVQNPMKGLSSFTCGILQLQEICYYSLFVLQLPHKHANLVALQKALTSCSGEGSFVAQEPSPKNKKCWYLTAATCKGKQETKNLLWRSHSYVLDRRKYHLW